MSSLHDEIEDYSVNWTGKEEVSQMPHVEHDSELLPSYVTEHTEEYTETEDNKGMRNKLKLTGSTTCHYVESEDNGNRTSTYQLQYDSNDESERQYGSLILESNDISCPDTPYYESHGSSWNVNDDIHNYHDDYNCGEEEVDSVRSVQPGETANEPNNDETIYHVEDIYQDLEAQQMSYLFGNPYFNNTGNNEHPDRKCTESETTKNQNEDNENTQSWQLPLTDFLSISNEGVCLDAYGLKVTLGPKAEISFSNPITHFLNF